MAKLLSQLSLLSSDSKRQKQERLAAQDSGPPGADALSKRHLIVMVHGLAGKPANWDVIAEKLKTKMDADKTLLLPTTTFQLRRTFEGIDTCGERLADEILEQVARHPNLETISIMGHSMGGLVARYAIGKLYDPKQQRLAGLKPGHFVTLATPHLGVDGDGPAQVPFIGWMGEWKVIGTGLQRVFQAGARPFTSLLFRRTGRQFFLLDAEKGREPLLVRMTRDVPEEGYFFMSGLSSFASRTCYANASGDHLVSWANSSIRQPEQLPVLSAAGRGVVREDPLHTGFSRGCLAADASAGLASATHALKAERTGEVRTSEEIGNGEGRGAEGVVSVRESRVAERNGESSSPAEPLGQEGGGNAGARSGGAMVRPRGGGLVELSSMVGSRTKSGVQQRGYKTSGEHDMGSSPVAAASSAVEPAEPPPIIGVDVSPADMSARLVLSLRPDLAASPQQPNDAHPLSPSLPGALTGLPAAGDESGVPSASSKMAQNGTADGASCNGASVGSPSTTTDAAPSIKSKADPGRETCQGQEAGTSPRRASFDLAADWASRQQWEKARRELRPAETAVRDAGPTQYMLQRLQGMPWRRVDVCFRGTTSPYFAHNHIQVTRRWLNWHGDAVAEHVAQQMAALERDSQVQQLMASKP